MTSRSDGAKGAVILTLPRRGVRAPSRAEIERGIARGRALQGAAVQAALVPLFRFLAGGPSRRAPGAPDQLPDRHHSCC